MRIENLMELAQHATDGSETDLLPVVEKEIVHYHILRSLSEERILQELSFQGGTCLRLCYGSPRYSEDLDFAAGAKFLSLDLDGLARRLAIRLEEVFGDRVRVKAPKEHKGFDSVAIARWTVIVRTAPQRDDLPSQRVKVEIASTIPYTRELRMVAQNYDCLPANMGGWFVACQSEREILADKLVSFASTEGYFRRRDLWDIPFLLSRVPVDDEVAGLVLRKHEDYGCRFPLRDLMERAKARAESVIEDGSFALEMRRFLSRSFYDNQLADGGRHCAREALRAYGRVVQLLSDPTAAKNPSLAETLERSCRTPDERFRGRPLGYRDDPSNCR